MSSVMTSLRKAISVITNNSLDHEHFGNSLNADNVPQKQQIPDSINSQPPMVHNSERSSQGMGYNHVDLVEAGVVANSNSVTDHKRSYVMGYWTPEEDRSLVRLVTIYGQRNWARVAKAIQSRNSKQCRERWQNVLSPNVKHGDWTEEEDEILINAHLELGSQWVKISKLLPGRTANAIKNHWNATKRKNLAKKNFKHTRLQDYIATGLNPEREALNRAPLQSQTNVHNLTGGPIDGYQFIGEGENIPEIMLGTNFAFPYNRGPMYGAECSGSSTRRALIRNRDTEGAKESSEVISKKPHCFCDKGKRKEGVVRAYSI